jgi:hypothetical protein
MQSKAKETLLISQAFLPAGFGTVPNWFRCRGVVGPVPQPLWIRNILFR